MNTTTPTNTWSTCSRVLILIGNIAMLVGALDPLEGSLIILPGSGLVVLGTFLSPDERRLVAYRLSVFILILIGVVALWVLSNAGGFGGHSGRSAWWGLLVLPYLIGWSMGIGGPKSPRWLLRLGVIAGLWYVGLMVIVLAGPRGLQSLGPGIVIGVTGILTIVGCITRLRNCVSTQA